MSLHGWAPVPWSQDCWTLAAHILRGSLWGHLTSRRYSLKTTGNNTCVQTIGACTCTSATLPTTSFTFHHIRVRGQTTHTQTSTLDCVGWYQGWWREVSWWGPQGVVCVGGGARPARHSMLHLTRWKRAHKALHLVSQWPRPDSKSILSLSFPPVQKRANNTLPLLCQQRSI